MDHSPREEEVKKAIDEMSNCKSPGADAIPVKVYKAGGPVLTNKQATLFQSFLEKDQIPQQLKDGSSHTYIRGNESAKL